MSAELAPPAADGVEAVGAVDGRLSVASDDVGVVVEPAALRVVVVDRHALLRDGLRSVLDELPDLAVVDEADDPDTIAKAIAASDPDVVIVDLHGRASDLALVDAACAHADGPAVVVLGPVDDADALRGALASGARGYLAARCDADELAAGVRSAASGRWVLGDAVLSALVESFVTVGGVPAPVVTPREREVLDLVADGRANRAVAEALGISTRTAQKHVESLFKKFGVHDRQSLVEGARRLGQLDG